MKYIKQFKLYNSNKQSNSKNFNINKELSL